MTKLRIAVVIVSTLTALLALGAWANRDQFVHAHLATGYAAKQTCSCLFVSGRSMESCLSDFPEDARETLSVTHDGETVRASVLFGAISAEAVNDGEFGCRLRD